METIGNIHLPITEAIRAPGNDIDAMDVLFDLGVAEMPALLQDLYKQKYPALVVVKVTNPELVLLLLYMPHPFGQSIQGKNCNYSYLLISTSSAITLSIRG